LAPRKVVATAKAKATSVVFSSYLSCALIVFLNCARVCVLFSVLAAFATAT